MSNFARKKLFLNLGRESADVDLPLEETVDENAVVEAEAFEESQEIASDAALTEDAIDATEGVEELVVATEAALASGKGLSKIEAAALNAALRSCTRAFVNKDTHLTPAVESYDMVPAGDGPGAKNANENNKEPTKEAKKGLKETAKAFFAAIIAKIKEFGKKIVNAFKFFKDRSHRSATQLTALAKRMSSLPDFNDVKINVNALNIHVDGQVSMDILLKGIEDLSGLVDRTFANTRSVDEHNFLQEGLKAAASSEESDWVKARNSLNAHTVTFFKSLVPNPIEKDGEKVSEQYPGGRRVVLEAPKDGEKGNRQLAIIALKRTDGQGELKNELTVKNKEVLVNVIDNMLALMAKTSRQVLEKSTKRVEADLSSVASALGKEAGNEAWLEGNKDRYLSYQRLMYSGPTFRYWLIDLSIVLSNNVLQIAEKALGDNYSRKDQMNDRLRDGKSRDEQRQEKDDKK